MKKAFIQHFCFETWNPTVGRELKSVRHSGSWVPKVAGIQHPMFGRQLITRNSDPISAEWLKTPHRKPFLSAKNAALFMKNIIYIYVMEIIWYDMIWYNYNTYCITSKWSDLNGKRKSLFGSSFCTSKWWLVVQFSSFRLRAWDLEKRSRETNSPKASR